MADIIQLLPDNIANQIAAGEVVQRPSSVVKELMENAIDAGSTEVRVIIKDSGNSLIQVIDNGCGMSDIDARMSFERHATSKIRKAEDLFAIRTMGFRGEALASISAVAQVEMKTKRKLDEVGTKIIIEGSEIKTQEACQAPAGTSIAVKNIFFNLPARRKFLKSPSVEMKHILDEFQRVALANEDVFFSLHHNNSEIYHLPATGLKQRVVGILGNKSNQRLVQVSEETDEVKVGGYIGKPEFAKKTRGDQYFFVNKRFVKSAYLNHALMSAYEGLLPTDTYPMYVVFLDIKPKMIDINVHPTKQEIKFGDERQVYNYLKVAVRHALGQINPEFDFDSDTNLGIGPRTMRDAGYASMGNTGATSSGPNRVSGAESFPSSFGPSDDNKRESANLENWEKLYADLQAIPEKGDPVEAESGETESSFTIESSFNSEVIESETSIKDQAVQQNRELYQIHGTYIVTQIKSGFMLIDQQNAHERILYEQYLEQLKQQKPASQKQFFPQTLELSPADEGVLTEIMEDLFALGFDIQSLGGGTYAINGVPADVAGKGGEVRLIERLLEQYKLNINLNLGTHENLARAMAKSAAVKRGTKLSQAEMKELIDQLFYCENPTKSPSGKTVVIEYYLDDLQTLFER